MPPPLMLCVELGPFKGAVFESGSRLKHITIGRTKTNRFQIKDETISQKHMSIDWINNAWMAQDLGSSNGTTLNGESIGVKEPVRVTNGDLVRIGVDTRIRIVMDEGLGSKPLAQVKEDEAGEVEAEAEAEVAAGCGQEEEPPDFQGKPSAPLPVFSPPVLIVKNQGCGEMSLRDWFKQETVRLPRMLRERAEANIREMELHAEQLKARLLLR